MYGIEVYLSQVYNISQVGFEIPGMVNLNPRWFMLPLLFFVDRLSLTNVAGVREYLEINNSMQISHGKVGQCGEVCDVRGCIVCTLYLMYVSVGNFRKSVVTFKLPMGKLVGVVKRVDVRGCMVCTIYAMYVSVGNCKKSVVTCKLPMGTLVGVVKHVDVRECKV